jgi:endonuclease/exonuclease/phosphatase family metal-dependent hydrolase
VIAGAWALGALWHGVFEVRVLNYALRGGEGPGLRIMNWNITGMSDLAPIKALVDREDPDILVLVNPSGRIHWPALIENFGSNRALAWDYGMMVLSKKSISRYGSTGLGLDVLPLDTPIDWTPAAHPEDNGRAMFVEIDATAELGRPIVLWVIDMPSDWRKSRRKLAKNAANAMVAWGGPVALRDERGQVERVPVQKFGFPAADIVVGDFNIPRGSASLSLMLPGMTHAFEQGGAGYVATYPRWRPWLHIDHAFVGPWLRARRYDAVNPGPPSNHFAQVAEVVKRK